MGGWLIEHRCYRGHTLPTGSFVPWYEGRRASDQGSGRVEVGDNDDEIGRKYGVLGADAWLWVGADDGESGSMRQACVGVGSGRGRLLVREQGSVYEGGCGRLRLVRFASAMLLGSALPGARRVLQPQEGEAFRGVYDVRRGAGPASLRAHRGLSMVQERGGGRRLFPRHRGLAITQAHLHLSCHRFQIGHRQCHRHRHVEVRPSTYSFSP